MAKAKAAETETAKKEAVVNTTETVSKEKELAQALEEMKREREALLNENRSLKAEADEYRANDVDLEETHDDAYWQEEINFDVPFYGEPEDISVKVNGRRFLMQRGERVRIPRFVAAVIMNQEAQLRYSSKMNKQLQDEFERDTKRYLGE